MRQILVWGWIAVAALVAFTPVRAEVRAESARAYGYVGGNKDETGDVDPSDVTLTGVTAGNTLVGVCTYQTAAAAPAFSSSPSNTWETVATTLWLANLRRMAMSVVLSAASGDTTLTCDVPGGDTAASDILMLAEYSGVDGALLDSDVAEACSVTELSTPTLTADAGGTLFVGAIHSQNASTGDGITERLNGGAGLPNSLGDKGGTANATMRWTWTGSACAGVIGFTIAESAGGAVYVPFNNPIRGGGLRLLLSMTQHPFGARLVQSKMVRHAR